jgi:hypothetical protein
MPSDGPLLSGRPAMAEKAKERSKLVQTPDLREQCFAYITDVDYPLTAPTVKHDLENHKGRVL